MRKILSCFICFILCTFTVLIFSSCHENDELATENAVTDEIYDLYDFTSISIKGMGNEWGETELVEALDKKNSYVAFQNNGNRFYIKIKLNAVALAGIQYALIVSNEDIDLSEYESYLTELFPTESLSNVVSLLDCIEADFGFYIDEISYEDEKVKAIIESIEKDKKIPSNTKIPSNFSFVLTGKYDMKEIDSLSEGKIKAAYLGEYPKNGEPYVVATFSTNSVTNRETVSFRNDTMRIDIMAELSEKKLSVSVD